MNGSGDECGALAAQGGACGLGDAVGCHTACCGLYFAKGWQGGGALAGLQYGQGVAGGCLWRLVPVLHEGDVGQGVGLVGQMLADYGQSALHGGYVASYAAVAHGGGVLQPCFDDDFGADACGVAHAECH